MRRSMIALIGFGLLSIAAPAAADPTTIRIPVTSADLESREAVADLYARVNEAATSVCRELLRGSAEPYPSMRSCRIALVDKALEDTELAPVARYHAEVRGRTVEQWTVASAR